MTLTPDIAATLAAIVLGVHLAIVLFNVVGLVVIPLGAWRHWRFVRSLWLRALHLAILAVVAVQALMDRACFLTLWQSDLLAVAGEAAPHTPLLERSIDHVMFWRLPMWFFVVLYVTVWLYALALWRLVPPQRAAIRRR